MTMMPVEILRDCKRFDVVRIVSAVCVGCVYLNIHKKYTGEMGIPLVWEPAFITYPF